MTFAELADRPWVLPCHPRMPLSALHGLKAAGVEPRAQISAEAFLTIPHLVQGMDLIGLVPARVAA